MSDCPHGMPTPASCFDCMAEGNLPVERVERERRAPNTPLVMCRYETQCPICENLIFVDDLIAVTTSDRWVHEGCVS